MKNYKLITDGAYSSARDQGGLAFVLLKNDNKVLEYSKTVKHTTNNKMEIGAIIMGLKCIVGKIDKLIIYSDSMYCIGCASLGWKRKKNVRLWKLFDEEMKRVSELCSDISFQHVKGHQIDDTEESKWNDYVDKLAVKASQAIL